MSRRDILTSPRVVELKKKKRKRRTRRIILFSLLIITIIAWLSYFSNHRSVTINKIIIEGNNVIDQEDIDKIVEDNFSGKYFRLFSKRNSFIYPKDDLYNDLIESFPRIKELDVFLSKFNTLNISLIERSGSFLWCGDEIPEKKFIGENCYYLNDLGYLFDQAPYFSGNLFLKFYVPILDNPLGSQMLSEDKFNSLVKFIEVVSELELRPIYLVIDNNEYNLYLNHSEKATSPKIIFNKENNLEEIASNLILTMKKDEFNNKIINNYNKLLYLDLRFNNKVLYKFKK
ncbi:MAG: hypothetical protein U9R00_00415 [Patescibacteria group bacterium]|nr:hypothetical protein [Patescibacteria group bacterium]